MENDSQLQVDSAASLRATSRMPVFAARIIRTAGRRELRFEADSTAREGANITLTINGKVQQATSGPYTECPIVYQQLAPMKAHDGRYPVFGSWVVNGVSCGVGIREDDTMITKNTSRFIPHQMVD